jgi:hypothetical protein
MTMRKIMLAVLALLFTSVLAAAPQQQNISDDGGRVLALE